MNPMIMTLLIFTAMIICFCINKIPMAVVSMSGLLALTVTKCIEPSQAVSSICNNTTLTIASMFVVSACFAKTSFIKKTVNIITRVTNGSFRKMLACYVFITFVLGQFIPSTTSIFALVCPLAIAMCKENNKNPSKVIYSIALVTVVGAFTITPLGPYAANYVENNGYQMQFGINGFINTPFTEMFVKLPPTIFAIIWAIFAAPGFAPEKDIKQDKIFNTKFAENSKTLSKLQENLTVIAFIFVIVSLVFDSFGMPTWIISSICACLLVAFGVMNQREAMSNMGMDVVLIYGGVSSLGLAFSNTGAGDFIAKTVLVLLGNTHNSYILGFAFFLTSFILTTLIYNRAVGKILIPIVLATASSLGCDPRGLVQMCYIGSMCSLLSPMATSIVPMMINLGNYNQKDLVKMGWLPSILLCLITVGCGMTMYPCF